MSNLAYDLLAETLEKQGIQVEAVKAQLISLSFAFSAAL